MGSSVGIGALIVGVSLLVVFGYAITTFHASWDVAEEMNEPTDTPKPELLNASYDLGNTRVDFNMTNTGAKPLRLSHIWFLLDDSQPAPLSSIYAISEWIFPGETIHFQQNGVLAQPSRLVVSIHGQFSAVAVT